MNLDKGAKSVTLPAGTYVIGDPCYHVPDEQWDRVLDESDFFNGQCHATFETFDGRVGTVVAFSTAYGDGVYFDGANREYGVDAGLIGIIPVGDVDEVDESLGHVIRFKAPVKCYEKDGVIVFGHVEINTDEDSDEYWDDNWNNSDGHGE